MWYIIIAIFVIALVVVVAKYVLFHPQINSVISVICLIWMLVYVSTAVPQLAFSAFILLLIPIIDCIRDVIIAPKYYGTNIEYELDKLYVIKSLTSLFTVGFARYIFFLVIDPHIARSVKRSLKREIRAGRKLTGCTGRQGEHIGWRIMGGARWYHFNKQVKQLEKKGIAISNRETEALETEKSQKKLEGLYPKKLMDKMLDKVAGNEEIKLNRNRAEQLLRLEPATSYLPVSTFEKIPHLVIDAMSNKGVCPLSEIKYFPELQSLNLVKPLKDGEHNWYEMHSDRWFDCFIIQALQPLVADGTFVDDDFNDKDPLDCHAYRYTKSAKPMMSQSPETNPDLALDDSDEDD